MSNFKGLNKLDRKMLKYINYKHGFFIEMGANNGKRQSNTYYYDKELDWTGLLIEPTHRFNGLKRYRGKPGNILSNDACCSFENEGNMIEFLYSDLMTTSLISDIENPTKHANEGSQFLRKEKVHRFEKKGVTLTSILEKNNCPGHIDFFSLDVEGMEMEVLRGIDFMRFKFKYILTETGNKNQIANFLSNYGYEYIDKLSNHDYLFTSKELMNLENK